MQPALDLGQGSQDRFASGWRAAGDGENFHLEGFEFCDEPFGNGTSPCPGTSREICHRPRAKPPQHQSNSNFLLKNLGSQSVIFVISVMTLNNDTGPSVLANAEARAASNDFVKSS